MRNNQPKPSSTSQSSSSTSKLPSSTSHAEAEEERPDFPAERLSDNTKRASGWIKPHNFDRNKKPNPPKDEKANEGVKLPPLPHSRSAPGTLQTVDSVNYEGLMTKLQDELSHERSERERMSDRVKDLERKLRNAANKPRLGITKNTPYKAVPLPPPPPVSPKQTRGLQLPALRTIPHTPSPQRWLDEQVVAASAQADMDISRSPEAARADKSKSRVEAIKKLESKGLNNWKERKAEKVARLQDLTVFRDSMWGSFFEWHEDYNLA